MNSRIAYRVLAVVLLATIGAHRFSTLKRPPGVDDYLAHIRSAASTAPRQIAGWVGEDVEVPAQALSTLAPNAIVSRHYTNVENGMSAGVLLVHCADAHDMAGHFPLRCYPAAGWVRRASRSRDWQVEDLNVTGTEYEFTRFDGVGGSGHDPVIVIANCILRPGGKMLRDMEAMGRSIVGAGGQATGAGQIQIYFDGSMPEKKRDESVRTLIGGYRPLLDAILAPATH